MHGTQFASAGSSVYNLRHGTGCDRMRKSTQTPEYRCVLKMLVELRHEAGLTQRELAERLKRERSFVWRIEKGERRLDVVEFYWVCRAMGIRAPESVYAKICTAFRSCAGPMIPRARHADTLRRRTAGSLYRQ